MGEHGLDRRYEDCTAAHTLDDLSVMCTHNMCQRLQQKTKKFRPAITEQKIDLLFYGV